MLRAAQHLCLSFSLALFRPRSGPTSVLSPMAPISSEPAASVHTVIALHCVRLLLIHHFVCLLMLAHTSVLCVCVCVEVAADAVLIFCSSFKESKPITKLREVWEVSNKCFTIELHYIKLHYIIPCIVQKY